MVTRMPYLLNDSESTIIGRLEFGPAVIRMHELGCSERKIAFVFRLSPSSVHRYIFRLKGAQKGETSGNESRQCCAKGH
jgi:hypothetical protein